jgi:inosose dehydratase
MGGFEPDPMPSYRDVLDGIAASGFAGTELGDLGFMPDHPAELRDALTIRNLQMIGAFTPVRLSDFGAHAESEATALRTARLLRALCEEPSRSSGPYVILAEASTPQRAVLAGRVGPQHSMRDEEWRAVATGAERIAVRVRDETGLPLVFHHHSGTQVETLDETARFLEMTDPELVGLCYDTGHFAYAGTEPLAALKQFRDRVWQVHFKDYRAALAARARRESWGYHQAVANGLFCELGVGDINFPGILTYLVETGYDGWIVVEDEMPPSTGDPLESAKDDRAYLRSLGL